MTQHNTEICGACSEHSKKPHKQHPDHSKDLVRINRIIGQLNGIHKMIEDRRYCPDILQQIKAVGAATQSLEKSILEVHLRNCVKEAMLSRKTANIEDKIDELMDLIR